MSPYAAEFIGTMILIALGGGVCAGVSTAYTPIATASPHPNPTTIQPEAWAKDFFRDTPAHTIEEVGCMSPYAAEFIGTMILIALGGGVCAGVSLKFKCAPLIWPTAYTPIATASPHPNPTTIQPEAWASDGFSFFCAMKTIKIG
jgi:hypothetical protein